MAKYVALDLSTQYITENDSNLLRQHPRYNTERWGGGDEAVILFSDYGAGYVLRIPEGDEAEEEIACMREYGFSEDGLIAVYKYAVKNDAYLLRLDRDGDDSVNELAVHEW